MKKVNAVTPTELVEAGGERFGSAHRRTRYASSTSWWRGRDTECQDFHVGRGCAFGRAGLDEAFAADDGDLDIGRATHGVAFQSALILGDQLRIA